ncbi:MAG: RNA methyltransferase [Pseudomonadota bacterium]
MTAQRVTARVTMIGAKGDGLLETPLGDTFAPYVAPGDEGVFDVAGDRALLVELTKDSDWRAPAPCPLYGDCGGCQLQHITFNHYTEWKRDRVVAALSQAGFDDVSVAPVETTPVASRRRAVFAVQKNAGAVVLGFNRRRSSQIVATPDCLVLRDDLRAATPALHALAEATPADAFDIAATACDNGIDVDIRSRRLRRLSSDILRTLSAAAVAVGEAGGVIRVALNGEPVLALKEPIVRFGAVPVVPPPGGFLQASAEGEAHLAALVTKAVGAARRVVDLYCGAGAFALRLAGNAAVYAADSSAPALAALKAGAARGAAAGVFAAPIEAEVRNLDERPLMAAELARFDAVVFDPPRAGAAAQAAELARSGVPVIVGVSCNPATFARDARLLSQGGYRLEAVTPVDQFIYASHIELVGVFRKA